MPGLWRLRLPLPWDDIGHVNAYAVHRVDGGITLVDTGGGGDPTYEVGLERALAEAGSALDDVRLVVGTHAHSDHTGLADTIRRRTGAPLWMHPDVGHFYDATRDPDRIAAARARRARAEGVPEAVLADYADVREETEGVDAAVAPDVALRGGEVIASTLGDWEVLHTPGHAPSHIALVQRERRIAILGDLVSPAFTPYFDYGCSPDPIQEFLDSLDAVAALGDLRLALPGHGRPIEDVAAVLALHRAGTHERQAAVEAAVSAGPGGAYVVTERVFGPAPNGETAVWNMSQTLAFLRHACRAGRIARDVAPDGTFSYRPV